MITLDEGGRGRSRQRFHAPPEWLRGLVEHVGVQRFARPGPAGWRVVPDGSAHLLVHDYLPEDGRPRCFAIVGPRSRYVDVDVSGRSWSALVRLRPGALEVLTGVSPRELRNRAVGARELGLPAGWVERALSARTPEATARAMVAGLPALLRPDRHPDAVVREAVRSLDPGRGGGRATVRETAERLGVAERTLRARFGDVVGLSPKRFARIARLHAAVRRAQEEPRADGSRLAVATGYHDQSHMIRDFRALLGTTPRAFAARGRPPARPT